MHTKQAIRSHRDELDARLKAATNGRICVETYKAAATLFRAAGIILIGAAIFTPGVSPSPTAYLVLAAIILGPDVAEAWLMR